MTRHVGALWLNATFLKFWLAQASSLIGTQFVNLAIPLVAVIELDASPLQMGLVTAMTGAPAVFGLFLGVWVDRRSRTTVLVFSVVARAVVLSAIPIAYVANVLTIELLYLVAFGTGFLAMLFSIAYRSILPALIPRDTLVEANSKLELAGSTTSALGPAIGGALIQVISAPMTMLVGGVAYLASALLFRTVRVDRDRANADKNRSVLEEILEGGKYFRQETRLIGLAGSQFTLVTFSAGFISIGLLYMVDELALGAALIGLILSTGSIGSFLGAAINAGVSARYGVERVMVGGLLAVAITAAALPVVTGPTIVIAVVLVAAMVLGDAGNVMYSINQVSVRQAVTADNLQGRVSSVFAILVRLGWPLGGLTAGTLAEIFGLRAALYVGAVGTAMATLWLFRFRCRPARSNEPGI